MKRTGFQTDKYGVITSIQIAVLYVAYKFFKTRLKLQYVLSPDAVVIYGNALKVFWKASGCYKVTVNDRLCLSGNSGFVCLVADNVTNPIKLKFYGIEQRVEKSVLLKLVRIKTKHEGLQIATINFKHFRLAGVSATHVPSQLRYKQILLPKVPVIEQLIFSTLKFSIKEIPYPNIKLPIAFTQTIN